MDSNDAENKIGLMDALLSLPLFEENIFLKMQAQNIAMVDDYLCELEKDLLRESIETDKTPIPSALFLGALSQMWIFAVYELLRTWRQMIREIVEIAGKSFASDSGNQRMRSIKKKKIKRPKISEEVIEGYYNIPFRKFASNPKMIEILLEAKAAIDPVFRRIVELRIMLAKHEVAGAQGVRANAPGYSRIDMMTGSLYWMVDKKDGTSETISRRSLSDGFRQVSLEAVKAEKEKLNICKLDSTK